MKRRKLAAATLFHGKSIYSLGHINGERKLLIEQVKLLVEIIRSHLERQPTLVREADIAKRGTAYEVDTRPNVGGKGAVGHELQRECICARRDAIGSCREQAVSMMLGG